MMQEVRTLTLELHRRESRESLNLVLDRQEETWELKLNQPVRLGGLPKNATITLVRNEAGVRTLLGAPRAVRNSVRGHFVIKEDEMIITTRDFIRGDFCRIGPLPSSDDYDFLPLHMAADRELIFVSGNQNVSAFKREDNQQQWAMQLVTEKDVRGMVVNDDHIFIIYIEGDIVTVLNRENGNLVKNFPVNKEGELKVNKEDEFETSSIATSAGHLFVLSREHDVVKVFTLDGEFKSAWECGDGNGKCENIGAHNGKVYITESNTVGNGSVRVYDERGVLISIFETERFSPNKIFISEGHLYLSGSVRLSRPYYEQMRVFALDGRFVKIVHSFPVDVEPCGTTVHHGEFFAIQHTGHSVESRVFR